MSARSVWSRLWGSQPVTAGSTRKFRRQGSGVRGQETGVRGEWREDKGGLGCFTAPKAPSGVWTFRELFRARGKARRLTYCCGQTGTVSLRKRVRRDALLSAPESAHQQWGGSPHRTEHWLSVAEGNCVAERRGGEQPEANDQSIINKMMNSIRPDALASLLSEGEAQNGNRPEREER